MKNLRAILEANKAKEAMSPKKSDGDDNKRGKEEKVPAGGKTMTGQQHNKIDVDPDTSKSALRESKEKHAVVTFGRMNPPTVGHEKLVNSVKSIAKKHNGDAHVYLSHSHDPKKNPLPYEKKHALAKEAFGDVVKHTPKQHAHMLGIAKHLDGKYDHLHMVVGSDRVDEAKKKLHHYNGKEYNFKSITVHSAGGRDPDADDVSGMSASKLRTHARAGDHESFKKGLPQGIQHRSQEMIHAISGKLHEDETLEEALNAQQRIKRAIQFKRFAARVKMGRQRALRRRASKPALVKRSRRLAIKFMRNRIMRGAKYQELPYGTRAMIDQRLQKRKKSIGKIAKRLMPKVARAEMQRKLGSRFAGISKLGGPISVGEDVLFDTIFEMLQQLDADYDYELTESEVKSLTEKAKEHEVPYEVVETVFRRGLSAWQLDESADSLSFQQYAFNRVNSFLNDGEAVEMDFDLAEEIGRGRMAHRQTVDSMDHGVTVVSIPHRLQHAAVIKNKKLKSIRQIIDEQQKPKRSAAEKLNARLNKLDPSREARLKKLADIASSYKKKKLDEEALEGEKRRCDMPQLTNFDAFHKDLTDSGHKLGHDYLNPEQLKPMQKHFNQEKVDSLKKDGWGDKGIIVSNDKYVIDGHHRWMAAKQMGKKIKARVASLEADDLIDFVKDKPYVEKKKLDEAVHSAEKKVVLITLPDGKKKAVWRRSERKILPGENKDE